MEYNADVNAKDRYEETALFITGTMGHEALNAAIARTQGGHQREG
jgi:hypothetical protein